MPLRKDHLSAYRPAIPFALAILCIVALWQRWLYFQSNVLPESYDGFYYLYQIKAFCQGDGNIYELHFLFSLLFSKIASLFSCNAPLALLVSQIFSFFLLVFALGSIAYKTGGQLCAISVVLIASSSNQIFHQIIAAPAQTFSFSILCFAISLLLSWREKKQSRHLLFFASALLLLTSALHIYLSLLCIIVLLLLYYSEQNSKSVRPVLFVTFHSALILTAVHIFFNPKKIASSLLPPHEIFKSFVTLKSYFASYQYVEFSVGIIVIVLASILLYMARNFSWNIAILAPLSLATLSPAYINYWEDALSAGTFSDRIPQTSLLVFALFLALLPVKTIKSEFFKGLMKFILVLSALCFFSFSRIFPFDRQRIGPELNHKVVFNSLPLLRSFIIESDYIRAPHGVQFMITYFLGNNSTRKPPEHTKIPSYIHIRRTLSTDNCSADIPLPANVTCVALGDSWSAHRVTQ